MLASSTCFSKKEAESIREPNLSTGRGVRSAGAAVFFYLANGKLVFWVTIEPVFIRHAEASAGSQCELTVLKKKPNWGSCSVLCKQPTDRKEGTTTTLRTWRKTCHSNLQFLFDTFCFWSSMEICFAYWQGETRAWRQLPSLPPAHNILFRTQATPVFSRCLIGFSVAHTHTHSGDDCLGRWCSVCGLGAEGQTPHPSWDAAVWPRGILEWTRWAPMRSSCWNSLETI